MAAEIVHDDDVAVLKDWRELLLDIGAKADAVDRAVEDTRRDKPILAQRAEESERAPAAVQREAAQALALRSPAAQRRHVGLDPGLVDENQTSRIETGLPRSPASPPASDVGAPLLKREQRFFEAQPLAAQERPHRVVREPATCSDLKPAGVPILMSATSVALPRIDLDDVSRFERGQAGWFFAAGGRLRRLSPESSIR